MNMNNTTKEGVTVRVGQIWKDLDKRVNRFVKVVGVIDGKAIVRRCNQSSMSQPCDCTCENFVCNTKKTKLSINRMHKHATGWALVQDVEVSSEYFYCVERDKVGYICEEGQCEKCRRAER